MPHPVYARQHWVCALSPTRATFETVRPPLTEVYELAVTRYRKLAAQASSARRDAPSGGDEDRHGLGD